MVFLVLISIGSFVASDREFSENENRYLAQFLKYLDEGWTIIVTSDHGLICDTNEEGPALMGDAFGVNAKVMHEMGFTVLKQDEEGNIVKEIYVPGRIVNIVAK